MDLKIVFIGAQGDAARAQEMKNLVRGFNKVAISVARVDGLADIIENDKDSFSFVVTKENIDAFKLSQKPYADPYLLAKSIAELRLGQAIRPNQCLVIEDTHDGMKAALRAGMNVIQVTDENGAPSMEEIASSMSIRYEGKIVFSEIVELEEKVYTDFLGYKPRFEI